MAPSCANGSGFAGRWCVYVYHTLLLFIPTLRYTLQLLDGHTWAGGFHNVYLSLLIVFVDPDQSLRPLTRENGLTFIRILVGCFVGKSFVSAPLGSKLIILDRNRRISCRHLDSLLRCFTHSGSILLLEKYPKATIWDSTRIQVCSSRPVYIIVYSTRGLSRYSLVPLTVLYSSLPKLFSLFLLAIWPPGSNADVSSSLPNTTLPTYDNEFISKALELLDEDKLDREWVVRNILGGMSAGFGLRGISDFVLLIPDIFLMHP